MSFYKGSSSGQLFHPLKRLPLEDRHRAAGAALSEYGGWPHPLWYGDKPAADAIIDEVNTVRSAAAIMDASPSGKIEVIGPDAEAFVNFIYYNTIRTLKPGALRYGFMLTEQGVVYDDGVVTRMDQNRFIISCCSSYVDGVFGMLEAWRKDGNDPDRIFIHDTTQSWPTVTVAGSKAREIVAALDLGFAVPRMKKTAAFVGDRGLHTPVANDPNRQQLVGLRVPQGVNKLPVGAHIVEEVEGKQRSTGFVTSSYDSPALGHPIALALIVGGQVRL